MLDDLFQIGRSRDDISISGSEIVALERQPISQETISVNIVFVRTADEGNFFMPERDQVSDCQIRRQRMIGVNPGQHGVERGFSDTDMREIGG